MKQHLLTLLLILFTIHTFGQDNQLFYPDGRLKCRYHRLVSPDTADVSKAIVTFTFINGYKPLAISYRQESMKNHFQWQYFQVGDTSRDKKVNVITANLPPDKCFTWQYIVYRDKNVPTMPVVVEPAALLLMDEDFDVVKIKFEKFSLTRP